MERRPRFYKRSILWLTVVPVLLLALLAAAVSNYFLARPLAEYLESRTDRRLALAANLGLDICDEKLAYLLELRMEDDAEVVVTMQQKVLGEVMGLSRQLGDIGMMVVDDQGKVLSSSDPKAGPRCGREVLTGQAGGFTCLTRDVPMRFAKVYFPFWRWHIVSFIPEHAYLAPSRMATHTVYLGTFGVALVVGLALLLVLDIRLRRPMQRLVRATEQVSQGGFPHVLTDRKDELGRVIQAFNVMVNNLERQQDQIRLVMDDLTESEERYRLFTENSLAHVTVVQEGRFVYANLTTLERTGYTAGEFIGMPAEDVVHPDDRARARRIREGLEAEGSGSAHYEFRYLTKSGEVRWLEKMASSVVYRGKPAILGHGIDITPRKRAQAEQDLLRERLEHSQRMEVVGTLAGGIAHDFNNLLQVIGGYSQLLLMKKEDGDPDRLQLTAIDHTATRGSELVRQLLSFGRRVSSRTKPVDLNQEVAAVARILERTIPRMISIETNLAPDLPMVLADPTQLEQILMNLGGNAKDAMPDGGKLVFTTGVRRLDEQFCLGLVDVEPGDFVELVVEDTGFGMDEATLRHIFEPFFTTKILGQGTGLGLSTVYGLVKAHKGHITCTSSPGRGTAFSVYLPVLADGEAAVTEEPEAAAEVTGGSETVLVADDEKAILDMVRETLGIYGYRVLTAMSGEQALAIYAADPDAVDLVILDLGMPGMGGARCLEEIKRLKPEAKVMVASGYADGALVDSCLSTGAVSFVPKPYRLKDFLAQVRAALDA